jgi:hypothetical protein
MQANRLSVSILIISIIFLLIPSIFVGAIDYFGFQTFERLGPFYLVGLLLAGNFLIKNWLTKLFNLTKI